MVLEKVGSALKSITRGASLGLKKAARKKEEMEHGFDRVFGKNALRNKAVNADNVRSRLTTPPSSNFFSNKDRGVKSDKYFKQDKDKKRKYF